MDTTVGAPHTRDRAMDHVAEVAQDAAFVAMLVSGVVIAIVLVVIQAVA